MGSSKILNFYTIRAGWIKFSKWVNIKNKLNVTKIGGATMEVSPPNGPSKVQTFQPCKLDT